MNFEASSPPLSLGMLSFQRDQYIVDLETVIGFCIEGGQALAFDQLLAEAAGLVLGEGAPLIYSLLSGVAKHILEEIYGKKEIRRIRGVANSVNIVGDHDSEWIRSILEDVRGANDGSWTLLPYLFATFMTSNTWNTTGFNVDRGGFNNNIHCLARCMSAVIAGKLVRLEREHQQRQQSLSNGHRDKALDREIHSRLSAEARIKSAMQLFVKFATGIVLDSWSEANSQYYSNSPSMPLALLSVSPRHSPAASLSHTSPAVKQPRGDLSHSQHRLDDMDSGSLHGTDTKHRNVRRSGPLDYSSSRKVKLVEGSTSGSTGRSPLPRFAVSRSGPLVYK
uniref:Uncharacterized protein n=1 Tax=Salix viminalis TaxID=40686 RepID=A0A6N2LPD8_SALVM